MSGQHLGTMGTPLGICVKYSKYFGLIRLISVAQKCYCSFPERQHLRLVSVAQGWYYCFLVDRLQYSFLKRLRPHLIFAVPGCYRSFVERLHLHLVSDMG